MPSLKNGAFTRTYGEPSTDTWPRFHMAEVEDVLASERAGRGIFRDEERVELNFPDNPYSKPVQRVTDEHRERWPKEYEAFRRGQDIAVSGTPIDYLPGIKPSMVRELKALDIMTVEQMANLSDPGVQRIAMGGRQLKERAQAYLDDATANALITQAQANEERWQQRFAEQELRLKQQDELIRQLQEAVMQFRNAPHPLMTEVPSSRDPMEALRQGRGAPEVAQSSLAAFADMPAPRKRKAQVQTDPEAS